MKGTKLNIDNKHAFFIIFAIAIISFYLGYKFNDNGIHTCHIDTEELEEMYSLLGQKTEDHELRFLNPNMTLRQVKDLYYATYPMSNGVIEWELTNLCD